MKLSDWAPHIRATAALVGKHAHVTLTSSLRDDDITAMGYCAEQQGLVLLRGRCRHCPIEGYVGSVRRKMLTVGHLFVHILAHLMSQCEPHVLAAARIDRRGCEEVVILPASLASQDTIHRAVERMNALVAQEDRYAGEDNDRHSQGAQQSCVSSCSA